MNFLDNVISSDVGNRYSSAAWRDQIALQSGRYVKKASSPG
jgi:hypothetical protein